MTRLGNLGGLVKLLLDAPATSTDQVLDAERSVGSCRTRPGPSVLKEPGLADHDGSLAR